MSTSTPYFAQAHQTYTVIHPLDAPPEEKRTEDGLGPIHMSTSVRWSLFVLRGYLLAMVALVAYHMLDLAGALKHFKW
jgi:hypothetical protein